MRFRSLRRVLACVAVVLAMTSPAAAQERPPATTAPAPDASAVGLVPGDVLRVAIWREPELSGEFVVDPDGVVTLPMIGAQRVGGVPLGQLRTRIMDQYRVNLRNPSITVTTLRRIQVLGEVNRPGLYNLDPTVSLSGAIATASGANPNGDLRRIRIVRDGQTYLARVGANETLNALDVRSGDQVFVGQKSWLARNNALVVSAALTIPGVIATILTIINRG